MHGHWVWRYSNGRVAEGPFVDDEMHGRWVIRRRGSGKADRRKTETDFTNRDPRNRPLGKQARMTGEDA